MAPFYTPAQVFPRIGPFSRRPGDPVPERMPERELEKKMLAFLHGEADVLLCTTIIESGLDVPRANTILIHRADALGLAQLYPLRTIAGHLFGFIRPG